MIEVACKCKLKCSACYTQDTMAKTCHKSCPLHMGQEFTSHCLLHCWCTCTDRWYFSRNLREIMLTKAIITLIFTSLGIIFVEPQGNMYCEFECMHTSNYTISVMLPHCIIVPCIYMSVTVVSLHCLSCAPLNNYCVYCGKPARVRSTGDLHTSKLNGGYFHTS